MKLGITYEFIQEFLPTKRHRIPRKRKMVTCRDIEVREVELEDFPVAFKVTDRSSVYDGAKTYEDFRNDSIYDFKLYTEEFRTKDGRLYKPVRYSYGTAISTLFKPGYDTIREILNRMAKVDLYSNDSKMFSDEKSVVLTDNSKEKEAEIQKTANNYVICDGKLWELTKEPVYYYNTFGLGHNHGGTSLFIDTYYNSNIPNTWYFNALHKEDAIKAAVNTATLRGDDKSIDGIKNTGLNIEVLIPDMVKRDPQKDHGDGDPFLNTLNSITEVASSPFEAGLLAMIATIK